MILRQFCPSVNPDLQTGICLLIYAVKFHGFSPSNGIPKDLDDGINDTTSVTREAFEKNMPRRRCNKRRSLGSETIMEVRKVHMKVIQSAAPYSYIRGSGEHF